MEFLTLKILAELNQKESPRLKWGAKILNKMGIKTITTDSSIKIFGNPNLKINKKLLLKITKRSSSFHDKCNCSLSFWWNMEYS